MLLEEAIEADRQCDLAAVRGPLYVISADVHVVTAVRAASLSPREVGEALIDNDMPGSQPRRVSGMPVASALPCTGGPRSSPGKRPLGPV